MDKNTKWYFRFRLRTNGWMWSSFMSEMNPPEAEEEEEEEEVMGG